MTSTHHPELLDVLTHEGVLVSLHVGFWRAAKRLSPSDLGLDADQIDDHLIHLGIKRLLKPEALQPFKLIESRARRLVEDASFDFLHGMGRFVPNARLPELREKLDSLQRQFWTEADRFQARYDLHRAEAVEDWREQAKHLNGQAGAFIDALLAAYPPREHLARRYRFDIAFYQIALPESLELAVADLATQDAVAQERAKVADQAARELRSQTEMFVAECVAQLRQETAQLCDEMLGSMVTGKSGVHQKTLNRLVNFIDRFKSMNFVGDAVLDTKLDQVREQLLIRPAEAYRDSDALRGQLQTGLARLRDQARQLAHQDATELVDQFGALGKRKLNLAAE